jgi:2-amino-4-hydroxy-6-hydroxymethyldihydropteridine diphosphokinase
MGNREGNLEKALELLEQNVTITSASSIYETEPVSYQNQPDFLNAACCGVTNLGPFELLHFVKSIERNLGRKPNFRNAPRPADIDILFYENEIIESENLIIPHPRIEERAFVLVPLAEIAPQFVHPLTKKRICEPLASLKNQKGVKEWQPMKFQFHFTSMQHTT